MKKITGLKIFLTIVFFGILFYKIDVNSILLVLQSLNIIFLICAFALVPLLYIIRTLRWRYFLISMEISLPFYQIFKIILIGNFYGLITPGKIGEFGRAFHLEERKSVTIPTILMEKLQDICVLLILSIVTILYFFQNSTVLTISIFLILFGVIGAILLSINEKFMVFLGKIFGIVPDNVGNFIITLKKLMNNYPIVFKSLLMTFFYYLIAYWFAIFIVIAGNMKLECIFVMPIVVLLGNIPVTISGLGLRESIGSLSFVLLGESAANGFVFSLLLFLFVTVLPAIYGYALTMTGEINDNI
jgi:glycosyltransferase 2 family protein